MASSPEDPSPPAHPPPEPKPAAGVGEAAATILPPPVIAPPVIEQAIAPIPPPVIAPPVIPPPPGLLMRQRVPPPRPAGPPIWPAFVIVGGSIAAALALGVVIGIVLVIVMVARAAGDDSDDFMHDFEALIGTPEGLLMLLLPAQAVFLGGAMLGAKLTRQPWKQTLGLGAPRGGVLLTLLLVLATLAVYACVSGVVWSVLPERLLEDDLFGNAVDHADGPRLLWLVLSLSLVPGVVEEMLFRGYLQRRLLLRWGPWAAIGATTAIFAAAHLAPLQAIAVVPLGVWVGVIAWRTGSIWPGACCHAANNALAFGLYSMREDFELSADLRTIWQVALIASVIALLASFWLLWRVGRRPQPSGSGPDSPGAEV